MIPADIPFDIVTNRLVLRCPGPGDGAIVYASLVESLAELRRFGGSLPWAMQEPAVELSERYACDVREKFIAHRRIIGMLGGDVEPHAEQPPRAH